MNLDEYQLLAKLFSKYPENVKIPALTLGLVNEAGEVAGKLKKVLRGDKTPEQQRAAMLDECGDTLWYLVNLIDALGSNLEDVATSNYNKLADRKARGVIRGSGDDR